jgi:hypothetical protein
MYIKKQMIRIRIVMKRLKAMRKMKKGLISVLRNNTQAKLDRTIDIVRRMPKFVDLLQTKVGNEHMKRNLDPGLLQGLARAFDRATVDRQNELGLIGSSYRPRHARGHCGQTGHLTCAAHGQALHGVVGYLPHIASSRAGEDHKVLAAALTFLGAGHIYRKGMVPAIT